MSERDTGLDNSRQLGPGGEKERKEAAKSVFALVVCVVGIILGLVGLVTSFSTVPATTADLSSQAVGILLGILGYYIGAQARDRGDSPVHRCDLLRFRRLLGPHPRHAGRVPQPPLRRARRPEIRFLRMQPVERAALGLCTVRAGVPLSEGAP